MAMHKCNGARKSDIFSIMMSETSLLILISFLFVIALLFGLRDTIQKMVGATPKMLFSGYNLRYIIPIVAGVFLLAGLVPAESAHKNSRHDRLPALFAEQPVVEAGITADPVYCGNTADFAAGHGGQAIRPDAAGKSGIQYEKHASYRGSGGQKHPTVRNRQAGIVVAAFRDRNRSGMPPARRRVFRKPCSGRSEKQSLRHAS